jgi:OmpA family
LKECKEGENCRVSHNNQQRLDELVKPILTFDSEKKSEEIVIVGYSMPTGSAINNLKLSVARARSVETELKKRLETSEYKIEHFGRGESRPFDGEIRSITREVDTPFAVAFVCSKPVLYSAQP